MIWTQHVQTLRARGQGFHLITEEILSGVPELSRVKTGMLQVFLQHTSAFLTLWGEAR